MKTPSCSVFIRIRLFSIPICAFRSHPVSNSLNSVLVNSICLLALRLAFFGCFGLFCLWSYEYFSDRSKIRSTRQKLILTNTHSSRSLIRTYTIAIYICYVYYIYHTSESRQIVVCFVPKSRFQQNYRREQKNGHTNEYKWIVIIFLFKLNFIFMAFWSGIQEQVVML